MAKREQADAPLVVGGARWGADGRSVAAVCALLAECGFDPAGARAQGTDVETLVLMLSSGEGQRILQLPVAEDGLGLTPAQQYRVRKELAARGEARALSHP